MNAFVQKEARLQLPTLAIGVVATLLLWFIPNDPGHPHANAWWFQFYVCVSLFTAPLIGLMLALNSFGREFSGGTFSSLLAQPISKERVWWTKVAVLASAAALLLALWVASVTIHFREVLAQPEARNTPVATVALLFTVVIFSGGLWTVLLFRQVAAAFWFTLLVPALLIVIVHHKFYDEALAGSPQAPVRLAAILTLSLYSLAGFVFARWLFLRAQDVQWSGGVIALPWRRSRAQQLPTRKDRRRRRPRAALWFKELRLHQSQFVLAGGLAVLHLIVVIARHQYHGFKESPVTQFIVEAFWVLWLFMPWLVGCATVAEERKLGTMEAQLCLPARRRTQFIIKLVSAALISVVLGAAMPLLFEGENIFPHLKIKSPDNFALFDPNGDFILLGNFLRLVNLTLPFLILAAIALSTFSVSFYVSTFSRNTLQAIAPATLGILAFYMWWFAAPHLPDNPLWHGWLIHYVGVPVLLPTLIGLAYWNFKQLHANWSVWRRNSIVLGVAFAFVLLATGLIYLRAWEWFTPMEPKHGATLIKPGGPTTLASAGIGWVVRLPDGRVWRNHAHPFALMESDNRPELKEWTAQRRRGEILEETNWLALAANLREMLGIKSDGSLWVTETPLPWTQDWWRQPPPPGPSRFIRLGPDTDWREVVIFGTDGLLLKTNGTLWRLGTNTSIVGKGWKPFRDTLPTQLGTNTDWSHISIDNQRMFLTKADGKVWTSVQLDSRNDEKLILDSRMTLHRVPAFDGWPGIRPVLAGWRGGSFYVSVLDDGSFAITAAWEQPFKMKKAFVHELAPRRIPLGHETNWTSAAPSPGGVVALKSDGTLWVWKFSGDAVTGPEPASARRLGKNSDWVALIDYYGMPVTLAGDGSLWVWQFPTRSNSEPRPFPPELASTRRPFLIGQIPSPGVSGQ